MTVIAIDKRELKKAYYGKPYACSCREEAAQSDTRNHDLLLIRIMLKNSPLCKTAA